MTIMVSKKKKMLFIWVSMYLALKYQLGTLILFLQLETILGYPGAVSWVGKNGRDQ